MSAPHEIKQCECGRRISRHSKTGICTACKEGKTYVPTLDQIREECERIREGWSEERLNPPSKGWTPHQVRNSQQHSTASNPDSHDLAYGGTSVEL